MAKRVFLREGPAAEYLDMSVAFLQAGRCRGTKKKDSDTKKRKPTPTPAFHKFGRLVKYDVADLDAWLDARRVDPLQPRAQELTEPYKPKPAKARKGTTASA